MKLIALVALIFSFLLFANIEFSQQQIKENKIDEQVKEINKLSMVIKEKNNQVDSLYFANEEKENLITQQLKNNSVAVNVSIYHANETECDSTPFITADLTDIKHKNISSLRIISVSRNLLTENGGFLKFGDRVMLVNAGELTGFYVVRDVMHPKYYNKVDVLVSNHVNNLLYQNSALVKIGKDEKFAVTL